MTAYDPTDAALLAMGPEGSQVFAVRHLDAVWRFARRMGADRATADDITQETFLAAFRAAGTFRGEGSARGWLLAIARNAWRQTWRRHTGEPVGLDILPDEGTLPGLGAAAGWGDDPERAAVVAEDGARLDAALLRLGEADREILVLRDIEELDTAEAASALGISPAAARVRLHRARLRLMAALRAGGGDGT